MTNKTIENLVNIIANKRDIDGSLTELFKNIDKRLKKVETNSDTSTIMLTAIIFILILLLSLLWINSDNSQKNNIRQTKDQEKKQAEYFRRLRQSGKKIRKIGNVHTFRDRDD